jgi:hypothetical protein
MKLMLILAAAVLVAAAPTRPEAAPAWLAGRWVAETEGRWTEESWSAPRGGVMLGTGLSGRGGEALHYEFMRIAPDAEGRLSFWGLPEGQAPVAFRLVSRSDRAMTFENPRHDFPTRIDYRREGDLLIATVSGPGGKGEQSWRYRRR